jgi:hypothetical protein
MDESAAKKADQNKMMLGFIVRRCACEIGHPPTPEEFAEWANNQERDDSGAVFSASRSRPPPRG